MNPRAKTPRRRGPRGQGCLYKRGVYYWLNYSLNGKVIRRPLRNARGDGITVLAEAEAARRVILAPFAARDAVEAQRQVAARLQTAEQQLAKVIEDRQPALSIADAWQTYLDNPDRPDSGQSTLEQYESQWGRFERWLSKVRPDALAVRDVTPEVARDYAVDLSRAGLSANSCNKHVALLGLVFRVLSEQARINRNPWDKIARRRQDIQSRRELTTDELRLVCETATGEMRLLMAIGIYTGLRLGDAATLRWNEVSLDHGLIQRMPHKTKRRGTTVSIPIHTTLATLLRGAKVTARGDYVLPETAETYRKGKRDNITDRIQRHLWDCGIDCHAAGTGWQIQRDTSGRPVCTKYGHVKLVNTGKRAIVVVGFHSFRHTFVSLCRGSNAPLAVVESIVGHSNPAMTRHYTHTGVAAAQAAIAALPNVTETNPKPAVLAEWAVQHLAGLTQAQCDALRTALMEDGGRSTP